jgi:hypothetical protein
MDGFKLNVDKAGFDQQRQIGSVLMQEQLETAHTLKHKFRWWWHESRVSWSAPADPVLAASEFAGLFLSASSLREKYVVYFADKAQREREQERILSKP